MKELKEPVKNSELHINAQNYPDGCYEELEKLKKEYQSQYANIESKYKGFHGRDDRSAKELMDSMQKTVEQIILQCDGADEFRSQFRNLVSSFKQVLDNVESQFVELMNKDRAQIEKAEKLNTTK